MVHGEPVQRANSQQGDVFKTFIDPRGSVVVIVSGPIALT
jgi:hypothetical protein